MLSGNIPYTAVLNCEGLLISYAVFPVFCKKGGQSYFVFCYLWQSAPHLPVGRTTVSSQEFKCSLWCNSKECSLYIYCNNIDISARELTCGNTAWLVLGKCLVQGFFVCVCISNPRGRIWIPAHIIWKTSKAEFSWCTLLLAGLSVASCLHSWFNSVLWRQSSQ